VNDSVISAFFGFGEDNCSAVPIPRPAHIEDGLRKLSAQGLPVYMLPGSEHTHTGGKASFYTSSVDSTLLYKWVAQLVDGSRPDPPSVSPSAATVEEHAGFKPTWAVVEHYLKSLTGSI